jgi:hypothetical protein
VEGLEKNNHRRLLWAAILVSLAVLTKYYAIALVPLLAAYGLIRERRLGKWSLWLLIPAAVLGDYMLLASRIYGHSLFSTAASYALSYKEGLTSLGLSQTLTTVTGLAFLGGSVAGILFLAPWLYQRRWLVIFAAVASTATIWAMTHGGWKYYAQLDASNQPAVLGQMCFWAAGGLGILGLAARDVWQHRDEKACLLCFWVFGTFVFAAFLNWSVNVRSILPLVPAVGLLVARRLDQSAIFEKGQRNLYLALAAAVAVAGVVTWADYSFAKQSRMSAEMACAQYGQKSNPFWFQGHWGFQYYMEVNGAQSLDLFHSPLKIGDSIALPKNNCNAIFLPPEFADEVGTVTVPSPAWASVMSAAQGAGFYASVTGPLPFTLGRPAPEMVVIQKLKQLIPTPTTQTAP